MCAKELEGATTVKELVAKLLKLAPNVIVLVSSAGVGCGPITEIDYRCVDHTEEPQIVLESY